MLNKEEESAGKGILGVDLGVLMDILAPGFQFFMVYAGQCIVLCHFYITTLVHPLT